jgi:hypothetical protein
VKIKENLSQNENPHITLSCTEPTPPKYSSELIEKKPNSKTVEPFEITGELVFESWD